MNHIDINDLKDALKERALEQNDLAKENQEPIKEEAISDEFSDAITNDEQDIQEEDISFLDCMNGVKVIKQDKIEKRKEMMDPEVSKKLKAMTEDEKLSTTSEYFSLEGVKFVDPNDVISYKTPGVQFGVFRKLKSGEYLPQDGVDLHGLTIMEAFTRIRNLLTKGIERNLRTVIIIHGKGEYAKPKALLKSYVAFWLKKMPEVLAYHTAMPYHGDKGATYVLLKKGEPSREETREMVAKRRKKN